MRTVVVASVGAMLVHAAQAGAGERIHEEVKASPDGVVTVENVSGTVVVTGWDEEKVLIEGTLGDGSERLDVDADRDGVNIEVVLPRRAKNVDGTDLVLRVPRGSRVEVETVSADVGVEEVEGEVDVETVSGAVLVSGSDDVQVETVSGSVGVSGARKLVRVETVSGGIEIEDCAGRADVSTTSGAISLIGSGLEVVDCESVSGTVEFDGDVSPDGSYRFECFSGGVTLYLPADVSADIEVEAFSGTIDSEFHGREGHRRHGHGPGSTYRVRAGDGDAEISVSTFSGSVDLRKR